MARWRVDDSPWKIICKDIRRKILLEYMDPLYSPLLSQVCHDWREIVRATGVTWPRNIWIEAIHVADNRFLLDWANSHGWRGKNQRTALIGIAAHSNSMCIMRKYYRRVNLNRREVFDVVYHACLGEQLRVLKWINGSPLTRPWLQEIGGYMLFASSIRMDIVPSATGFFCCGLQVYRFAMKANTKP